MAEGNKAESKKRLVSRREFLVVGGAVIVVGALSACASKTVIETITSTMTATTNIQPTTTTATTTSTTTVQPPITTTTTKTVTTTFTSTQPTVTVTQTPTLAYMNAKTYTVKRTFSITNGDAAVDIIRIWLPAITNSESQRVIATEPANIAPAISQIDASTGTSEDFWEFRSEPAQGTCLSFTQQYTVEVFQVMLNPEDPVTIPYDRSNPEYLMYTRAEKFLEADDQEIISTARKSAGNETSPCRIARLYYEYVNNYMKYQLIDGIGGALFALKNGYGECGDYAALFVALCRASGVPARPVVGRWALQENGDNHVWAEFYLQDVGWVPVDPSFGPKNNADTFGKLDNGRIIFNKAYNIALIPKPQWISPSADGLQTYFWEFWCSSGNTKTITVNLSYESSEEQGR